MTMRNRKNQSRQMRFYEPRTGSRFQNRGGKIERLEESGERIEGFQTRISNPLTIRARGSFFGGSSKQASQNKLPADSAGLMFSRSILSNFSINFQLEAG